MKRKLIVSLTGIVMSLALAVTGCAGTAGSAGAAGPAASESGAETAGSSTPKDAGQTAEGESAKNKEDFGSPADHAQADDQIKKKESADGSGSKRPAGKKPSGKKSKGSDSGETTAELKTVKPSAYAGQTVYGKVISITDSQITVSLGTYNKDTSVTQTSVTEEDSEVIDAAATINDSSTDTSGGKADAKSKKKKSRFTANGEQMTVAIPESLSNIEIKEKYVLAITLDDEGNVTAIGVESKGHSKSGGTQSGENGSDLKKGNDSESSTEVEDQETTNL